MLAGVQIEHELAERALEPRECRFGHDETGARHFRRGLEIHQPPGLADVDMVVRRKTLGKGRRRAVAMVLDIIVFVLAERHVGERNIGNFGKRGFERGDRLTLLVFAARRFQRAKRRPEL